MEQFKDKWTTIFGMLTGAAGAAVPYVPAKWQWIPQLIAAIGIGALGYNAADRAKK